MRDEDMTDVSVRRGLHRAQRWLRDGEIGPVGGGRDAKLLKPAEKKKAELNSYWVPYVHFGV